MAAEAAKDSLRTGCVRALMDVAQEIFASVALLPVALPYQLVPKVHSNGRFACSVNSRMDLVWRACQLEAQDSRALTNSLTLTSTKDVTESARRNDVNHNLARHGSVGTLDVERVSVVELMSELERWVCQRLQLGCPLRCLESSDKPWRSRRSHVDQNTSRRLGRLVCGASLRFRKEMRGTHVGKTSPSPWQWQNC